VYKRAGTVWVKKSPIKREKIRELGKKLGFRRKVYPRSIGGDGGRGNWGKKPALTAKKGGGAEHFQEGGPG